MSEEMFLGCPWRGLPLVAILECAPGRPTLPRLGICEWAAGGFVHAPGMGINGEWGRQVGLGEGPRARQETGSSVGGGGVPTLPTRQGIYE